MSSENRVIRTHADPGAVGISLGPDRTIGDRGGIERALAEAEAAIARSPEAARAWSQLAHLRASREEHDVAAALGRRAVSLDPEDHDARYNLGVSLHRLGLIDEATHRYRTTIEMERRHLGAWVNLGAILRSQGNDADAVRTWRGGFEEMASPPSFVSTWVVPRCNPGGGGRGGPATRSGGPCTAGARQFLRTVLLAGAANRCRNPCCWSITSKDWATRSSSSVSCPLWQVWRRPCASSVRLDSTGCFVRPRSCEK